MNYQLILVIVKETKCYTKQKKCYKLRMLQRKKKEKSYRQRYSARFIDEFRLLLNNDIFYYAKEKFRTKYLITQKKSFTG